MVGDELDASDDGEHDDEEATCQQRIDGNNLRKRCISNSWASVLPTKAVYNSRRPGTSNKDCSQCTDCRNICRTAVHLNGPRSQFFFEPALVFSLSGTHLKPDKMVLSTLLIYRCGSIAQSRRQRRRSVNYFGGPSRTAKSYVISRIKSDPIYISSRRVPLIQDRSLLPCHFGWLPYKMIITWRPLDRQYFPEQTVLSLPERSNFEGHFCPANPSLPWVHSHTRCHYLDSYAPP